MLLVALRSLIVQNGVLRSVVNEVMTCAFLPTVEDRLVPPVVVLSAEDKYILRPDQALRKFEACLLERPSEVQSFRIGVKHIDGGTVPGV